MSGGAWSDSTRANLIKERMRKDMSECESSSGSQSGRKGKNWEKLGPILVENSDSGTSQSQKKRTQKAQITKKV